MFTAEQARNKAKSKKEFSYNEYLLENISNLYHILDEVEQEASRGRRVFFKTLNEGLVLSLLVHDSFLEKFFKDLGYDVRCVAHFSNSKQLWEYVLILRW